MAKFIVSFSISLEVDADVSPETQDELDCVFACEDVQNILSKKERRGIISDAIKKVSVNSRDVDAVYYVFDDEEEE